MSEKPPKLPFKLQAEAAVPVKISPKLDSPTRIRVGEILANNKPLVDFFEQFLDKLESEYRGNKLWAKVGHLESITHSTHVNLLNEFINKVQAQGIKDLKSLKSSNEASEIVASLIYDYLESVCE